MTAAAIGATAQAGPVMLVGMKRPAPTKSKKQDQAPRIRLPAALADRYGGALQDLDVLYVQDARRHLEPLDSAAHVVAFAKNEFLRLQAAAVQACEDARSKRWKKALAEAVKDRERAQTEAVRAAKQAWELADFIRRRGQIASAAIDAGVRAADFAIIRAKGKQIIDEPLVRLLNEFANNLSTRGNPSLWDQTVNLGRVAIPMRVIGSRGPRLKAPTLLSFELEVFFRRFTVTGQAVAEWAYSSPPDGGEPGWPIVASFVQAALGGSRTADTCRKLADAFRKASRDAPGRLATKL